MEYSKEDIGFLLAVFATTIVEGADVETDVETDEEKQQVEEVKAIGLHIIEFLENSPSVDREESMYCTFMRMANKYLGSIKDESN